MAVTHLRRQQLSRDAPIRTRTIIDWIARQLVGENPTALTRVHSKLFDDVYVLSDAQLHCVAELASVRGAGNAEGPDPLFNPARETLDELNAEYAAELPNMTR